MMRIFGEISQQSETLWERLYRAKEGSLPRAPSASGFETVLAPWARVVARGSYPVLVRRLSWDEVEPAEAAAALMPSEPSDRVEQWIAGLIRYVQLAKGSSRGEPPPEADRLGLEPERDEVPFAELWRPWVELAAEELSSSAYVCEQFAASCLDGLRSGLLKELSTLSAGSAYERFDRLRANAECPEANAELPERSAECAAGNVYRKFVAGCLNDPLNELYLGYPVLARQTCRRLQQWCRSVTEFAERLSADRAELEESFNQGKPLGPVVKVVMGVSDRHRGGRQVLIAEFEAGYRLVYKPRSLAPEQAWMAFLDWCESKGLPSTPPAAKVLLRADYGWMEYVAQERLPHRESAPAYYRCAGTLLALAYVLRMEDLHAENLVATAGGPTVVDCEMMLQPVRQVYLTGEEPQGKKLASGSCLASGLLPALSDERDGKSQAGLMGQPLSAGLRRVWRAVNTDEMTLVELVDPGKPIASALLIGDEVVPPEEFAADLCDGFESAYRFLSGNRERLLEDDGPLRVFRDLQVRVLFRASQDYGRALQLMEVPRNQKSGLSSSWLLEGMLSALTQCETRPAAWSVVQQERDALDIGDVPLFTVATGSTTTAGATDYFAMSGLAATELRVGALSEKDLARQLRLVRRTLIGETANRSETQLRRVALNRSKTDLIDQHEVAVEIGKLLLTKLDRDAIPSRLDLANGQLGCALFFAALRSAGGGPHFAQPLNRLLEVPLGNGEPFSLRLRELPPGGLSGVGSVIWSLVWLAHLLEAPDLLIAAESAARNVERHVQGEDENPCFDLDRGLAGAIVALLALAEATAQEWPIDVAIRCGEQLLENQCAVTSAGAGWPNRNGLVQTGWSHGTAGAARALFALSRVTSDRRFAFSAIAAIGYERSRYDPEFGNWPVMVANAAGDRRQIWMNSYCRGAPGIALSRLLAPDSIQDPSLIEERRVALRATSSGDLQLRDHLCCGNLGRSSVLLSAGDRLGDRDLQRSARSLTDAVVKRASTEGSFSLDFDRDGETVHEISLLHGLAGVGYHLLRLSGGVKLPDVLALELPSEFLERAGGEERCTE